MSLDIILRTCSNSLLKQKNHTRICGDNRDLMLRKCFYSLIRAIKASQHQIKLTVLDDHSDADFLDFIKAFSDNIDLELIHLEERGPNYSAHMQFKVASECEGLVYIVEDDYLHEENAIDFMLGAYFNFVKRYNTDVVIYPYDCSLRYVTGEESLTTLYHDGIRYWRGVDKTANTMLVHSLTLKSNWKEFENLGLNYPKVLEDDTINKIYYNENNKEAGVRAFSPIPSIAYHLGYSTPFEINTTHISWKHLWSSIEPWEFVQGWFYYPEFFRHVITNLPEKATIVEIGSWRGRSTCCLATYVKESNKDIKIHAIDTFEGSDEKVHREIMSKMTKSLYDDFISNINACGVADLITPMKMTSIEASEKFKDKTVDFIFIDGAHDYDSVKEDIDAWLPKVKSGGLICGDDYGDTFEGVKRAVTEKFGSRVNVHKSCWYVAI